jgi:hypothetical protein
LLDAIENLTEQIEDLASAIKGMGGDVSKGTGHGMTEEAKGGKVSALASAAAATAGAVSGSSTIKNLAGAGKTALDAARMLAGLAELL